MPTLADFETQFRRQQELGLFPPDAAIEAELRRMGDSQRQATGA
jgi:hypothetical protein